MAVKFRIKCMSSERGWGREFWTEDFNTFGEAKARIKHYNDQNTALTAPDYYEQAEDNVIAVEV
jgi:hypothetical protein